MTGIISMTEEQKFRLEIYRLLSKDNSAVEEVSAFIGADQLKLESLKLHYNDDGTSPDFTSHTVEVVRKSKGALDLFTTGA